MNPLAIINLIELAFGMLTHLAEELKGSGVLPADHALHSAIAQVGTAIPDAKKTVAP
jgi:hypothetical protein